MTDQPLNPFKLPVIKSAHSCREAIKHHGPFLTIKANSSNRSRRARH